MGRTIAAIATALGTGSIAVVRISGDNAIEVADRVFSRSLENAQSHTVHYGFIKDLKGNKIDEVLLTVMKSPKTFTAEDTVEISTHGGMTASRRVLDAVIKAGAVLAEPGEFTKKAFLNGRIDLSQAEAVIDIINAKNELSQRNALSQLEGALSEDIKNVRNKLINTAARMQVLIDYPDEDLEDITPEEIESICSACMDKVRRLLATADDGRIINDGVRVAIVGKPNVGKSSLLNALSGSKRAIVTDIAGTTRDTIEENISIDGIPILLVDTAGIRESEDVVEQIGVERSKSSISDADLVIFVLDAASDFEEEDKEILKSIGDKKCIIILNKSDLERKCDIADADIPIIETSALTGKGIDELKKCITKLFKLGEIQKGEGAIITNMRHKTALICAEEALRNACGALVGGMPTDIASIDINAAISSLGEITGETVSDDIVNEIFHSFCVGK